ncbi:methionyl-tRNA synthetase [Rufibacter sp. DG15C]|uniref:methionine--tRNA ligase n=1 Tax=Rufibacter sp. DG15C TaxID=1379909 RepID=UPI00078E2131|nr:methionine--tRNA ligase [Rufibacter sp. DG15C]AMM52712.1 methionyl-tRNA synthetase [Rufibacter sp. DG15C]
MAITNPKRYTITAALPYANGPVHIGHLAGVYIPADVYSRYLRSRGRDVKFVCGSDEHGVPITIRAKKEGITPQQAVDKYHELIKKSFADFNISFDVYSRTSSKTHAETASNFFKKLYEEGKFIEQTTQQYFDEKAQQFLADRYIVGTCPKCGNDGAYGDQCESCGTSLSATDLINPKSTLSGEQPVMRETKHWYLPLDQYEPWLREWIVEGHKNDWKTNVYGQCKSWIDQGLQPRAVTRDLDWGVPVPVEGAEGKVLYVWFDAPIGYISATKDLTPDWELYWKDQETKLVHFIGKDNIVFHCIIFPAMLKAHGDYVLPDNVPANEFLNLEGDKISTSRNWAVWLHEYLEDLPGKADVLRYVLCANAPETKDNDFTWKDFQARNNNELLAIFGNFINRAVVLTHKYYHGAIPQRGELTDFDQEVLANLAAFPEKIAASLEQYRFKEALGELMNLARLGNKYLADTEPWKLFKSDPVRVETIMNIALQISASLTILSEPFLPETATKLANMLQYTPGKWDQAGSPDLLPAGHVIGEAALLFEKIEDAVMEAQVQKLLDTKKANEIANAVAAPAKEDITFDDFSKIDIRVGTILEAEKVAKTKKLLKLKVDTGLDQRTIVSGIAEHFNPEDIIGQQVSVLVNLAPREIKGILSQGMLLMAENADGSLAFMQPSKPVVNGGGVS